MIRDQALGGEKSSQVLKGINEISEVKVRSGGVERGWHWRGTAAA